MPYVDIPNAGDLGIVSDLPYGDTPPNAWTSGENVRFFEGRVQSFTGERIDTENSGLTEIWGLNTVTSPENHYWVQGGDNGAGALNVFAFDGTTHNDITPAGGYLGARENLFFGDVLNQNLVVANGADVPHYWNLNPAVPMEALPAWDVGWTARGIRAFKGFLIAFGMIENGLTYPYRVRWSDEAPPGGLPQSWDALDPTVLAGAQDLGDTTSYVVGGKNLRDQYVLYTENETIGMQLVRGDLTMRFSTISRQSGLLAARAVSTLRGNHIAVTDSDVVRMNGQTVQSIIDRKRRNWLFRNLDQSNFGLVFTVINSLLNEVWVCFPSEGSTYCDTALTWSWEDGTWGRRDLPEGCLSIAVGLDIVGLETLTWATNPFTWNTWNSIWNQRSYNQTQTVMLIGADSTGDGAQIRRGEVGSSFAGVPKLARIQKLGMRLAGERRVAIHEIWPRMRGGPVTVRVGFQEEPNGPVNWRHDKPFDPETDRKITCRVSGRYPCISFESNTDVTWELEGYQVKYSERGYR